MSRELKVRAWDNDANKMLFDFHPTAQYGLIQKNEGDWFCGGNMSNGDWNEPILMQYTGLKDKNGKEIFWDDIVQVPYGRGIVVFKAGCFMIQWIDDTECLMELLSMKNFKTGRPRKDLEVIGNKYQDPELLK